MTTVSQSNDRCQHVKNSLFYWPIGHPGTHSHIVNLFSGLYFNKCTGCPPLKTGPRLVKELIVIIPLLRNFKSEIVRNGSFQDIIIHETTE